VSLTPARRRRIALVLFFVLVVLALAACSPAGSGSPGASGAPTPSPTPLVPASPGADPMSLLAWAFTPIFQVLFLLLAFFYSVIGDVGVAIIILTLIIRAIVIPLFRQQTVSQRRIQMLQPELKEIQRRYKGDRAKVQEAQMALYKERGINPAAGCLPSILQMVLLIPMYSVIRDGLTNYNPDAMLRVFGVQLINLHCPTTPTLDAHGVIVPCIHTNLWWLGGLNVGQPEILFTVLGFGVSGLALVSSLLQLVQSRMVMPPAAENDSSASVQRQTMVLLPLISILYGGILPAGLFIYWIVTTVFSIVQQYLIVGFGSLFPLFGWTPGFARNHTPRFPVAVPPPDAGGRSVAATRTKPDDRLASAAATVRPRARGRQGRRGRRR
jgi:YidC/Oxa1 family membrane protein insertase